MYMYAFKYVCTLHIDVMKTCLSHMRNFTRTPKLPVILVTSHVHNYSQLAPTAVVRPIDSSDNLKKSTLDHPVFGLGLHVRDCLYLILFYAHFTRV